MGASNPVVWPGRPLILGAPPFMLRPRRGTFALPAVAVLAACSGQVRLQPDGGLAGDAGVAASQGDLSLRSSNLVAARAAYLADLSVTPSDAHAAFGAALTRVLLLPSHPAVDEVLASCQEQPLRMNEKVLGPSGAFAQDRDARRGTGGLTLARRQGTTGTFAPVAFLAETFRTSSEPSGLPDPTGPVLSVRIQDLGFAGRQNAEVRLRSPYANAARFGLTARPLVDGLEVKAEDFGGTLSVTLPSADGMIWDTFESPVSGTLAFKKVGTGLAGDVVTIELRDLVVEGRPRGCVDVCGPEDWPYLKITGTVSDTISAPPASALPFAAISEDAGPPHRADVVVLLDRCAGLSAETLRLELMRVLDEVELVSGHLAVVLADPNAEVFQFRVPGGLFFVDGEIPVNITDARVLSVATDVLLALGRGFTQYRTLAKRFDELIGEYELWLDAQATPNPRRERGFLVDRLVDELNAVFLDRQPGFDLSRSRSRLLSAMQTARLALGREPKNSGLFNFQTANSRTFATDLAAQIEFLQTSSTTPGLQPFPHAPDYRLSLHAGFASPIDLQALHLASTTGQGVFSVRAGTPDAERLPDRNDALEIDTEGIQKAFAPVLSLPADLSEQTCDARTPCPGKYSCALEDPTLDGAQGRCQAPGFLFLDKDALKRAVPATGDPAFLNLDVLRPLQVLF